MKRTLYALLVGINAYPDPKHRLSGCINDVERMREYLVGRCDGSAFQLALVDPLTDVKATRQAVIDAFRDHLGQAKKGDVALFYFSGHGSQERAPREFWHLEPDKLDETLVCYDSRSGDPGCYDLADKELAYLIEQVARDETHVIVILDCCHSGSGTRDIGLQKSAVRRVETDLRERPLGSYLMTVSEAEQLERGSGSGGGSGWSAAGRHILLAACAETEEAVEYEAIGPDGRIEPRGVFSYFLGEALRSATGPMTYRDLHARTNAQVRAEVRGQSPQIETIHPEDLDGLVFDGAIRPSTPYFTLAHGDEGWLLDGGAVHGLPPVSPDEPILLDVFPFTATDQDLDDAGKSAAQVSITALRSTRSLVEVVGDRQLDEGQPYKAVIAALPLPRITVEIEPHQGPGAALAHAALERANQGKPSLYVREVRPEVDGTPARFLLRVEDAGYIITSPENYRPFVARVDGLTESTARLAVRRLEHMARWTLVVKLDSPAISFIGPLDVDLVLIGEDGEPLIGPEIRMAYRLKGQRWEPARFKIKLVNRTDRDGAEPRDLYCGLLDLTDSFAINAGLHEAGSIKLSPGEDRSFRSRLIAAELPDKFWQQGMVERKDVLKLIVSTNDFDVRLMTQAALDMRPAQSATRGQHPRGSLNRLMQRVQHREFVVESGGEINDWWSTQVTFTTVRPLEAAPVPNSPGRSVVLAGGVRLLDHPGLRANARLSSAPVLSRDLGNLALPRLLRDDPTVSLPFSLVSTRGTEPGLSTLELTDVQDESYRSVTPEAPLKLLVPLALAPGESVLAVGYDGEFFLPLGRAEASASGTTEIILERLSAPTSGGKKSLAGSIKIFFQKVVGPCVGRPSEYPILALAEVDSDDRVHYIKEIDNVGRRVAAANKILLYVHGITGDTREMASSARRGGFSDRYDLILTFDYENLGTPIAENARLLGDRLKAIGLGRGHRKHLDIAAHSMGGLVARWLIEREGGEQMVRRLVMLGTPNGGSPWPRVVDWATATLALGLNGLTGSPWPARVLRGFTAAFADPQVALREMNPGSETLAELGGSPDPGIPYTMLAGNTSIIPAAPEGLMDRLLNRLFGTHPMYGIANQFFRYSANDIAVAVESMQRTPGGWSTRMKVIPTACDHLTYFETEAGLSALEEALR
jgi:hypothetical protein